MAGTGRRSLVELARAACSPAPEISIRARDALARQRRAGTTALIDRYREGAAEKRAAAVDALFDVGDASAVGFLLEVLAKDPAAPVRDLACSTMAAVMRRAPGRTAAMRAALIRAWQRDASARVRASALGVLVSRWPAEAARAIAAASDSSAAVRSTAVQLLAEARTRASEAALVRAVRDRNPAIRQLAAFGVGQRQLVAAVPALIRSLDAGDGIERYAAASALARMDAPAAGSALARVLEHDDEHTRLVAIEGLKRYGGADAAAALVRFAIGDIRVAEAACGALQAIVERAGARVPGAVLTRIVRLGAVEQAVFAHDDHGKERWVAGSRKVGLAALKRAARRALSG